MGLAILATLIDVSGADAEAVHHWFGAEHAPGRGSRGAQRWIGATEPHLALSLRDMDSLDALSRDTPPQGTAGQCRELMRAEAEQVLPGGLVAPDGAPALLFIGFNIPPEIEADFNAWYDTEHLPALAAVPGVLAARRFRAPQTSPRYFATYHLTAPDVPDSPAWKRAVDTPWSARMRPHFHDRVRIVCRAAR